jgi:hypothetical protein
MREAGNDSKLRFLGADRRPQSAFGDPTLSMREPRLAFARNRRFDQRDLVDGYAFGGRRVSSRRL